MALYVCTGLGITALGGAMQAALRRAGASALAGRREAAIIDQTYDAILVWDWEGAITFWNRGAERVYGIPREEALGRESNALLKTRTAIGVAGFLSALDREGAWEGVLEHTTRDGRTITVETRMVLIREEARAYVIEANRDITIRREAEEALRNSREQLEARVRERTAELAASHESTRQSEERMSGIVNSAMDAIISVDSSQRILLFNAAAGSMFRCPAAEAMGRSLDRFIPQRFREQHRHHVGDFGKTGVTSRSMHSLGALSGLRADGEEFPIEASISQITAGGEKIFTVILRDITARKRAEAAGVLLAAIVESSFDAIIGKDLDGVVTSWNVGAERMFGYSAEEMVGNSITRLIPPDHIDDEALILGRIRQGERVEHFETVRRRKDGKLIDASVTVSPIKDDRGNVVGASKVVRDITERKEAEEKVRLLNTELEKRVVERTAQLEVANKELEAFSYSVSHDLRAPLRAVNGFAGMVVDEFGSQLPAEAARYLERIRNAAIKMGQLIDDLLAFSRLGRQPLKRQEVNMAQLVQNVLDDLAPERKGRQIDIQAGVMPDCWGDPALLKQVWVNLLSNAIKYTRGCGGALVETGCESGNRENIYYVRDNGAGFDMKYAHKLFGVFQRLHRAEEFEGTGVGLAIVQRVIHRHGGRVWAEAEKGRGAIFRFTLGERK